MGQWTSPIYVFFRITPSIEYIDDRRAQVFECAAGRCNGKNGRDVSRFLDEGDRKTFVGMPRCAGVPTRLKRQMRPAMLMLHARSKTKLRDGSIIAEFGQFGKGK